MELLLLILSAVEHTSTVKILWFMQNILQQNLMMFCFFGHLFCLADIVY